MPPDPNFEIHVNNLGEWRVSEDRLAEACRADLFSEGHRLGEVSITLLDDDGIRSMNQEYLQKDGPTDVIAFPLHGPGEPVLGDIYLGFEQARRQASELGIPLEEELPRLTIHGVLHLLGYQHPDGEERLGSEMFLRQEELLEEFLSSSPG
jgi:probable rRNA maturation factor